MTTLALFGTSADPPTVGHQQILGWLGEQYDQVAAWAADNPFKEHGTPLRHRMAMLSAAIRDLPHGDNIAVYSDLSHRFTRVTVERARDRWPNAQITLTTGSDLIEQLPRWYQVTELFQLVDLLVIPRPGYGITAEKLAPLKQLGATVTVADLTGLAVSSTVYRNDGDSSALTPSVATYIQRENLYLCQNAT
ncbi:MAG: nicotinate-nucleotide adenylyltransferase [Cyanobacteria bacterium P01_F01_bin.153]